MIREPYRYKPSLRTALRAATMVACIGLQGCLLTGEQAKLAATAPAADTYEAVLGAGDAKLAEGDFPAAATLFRNAHTVRPDQAEPLTKLGFALALGGSPAEASEAFRSALFRDANSAEARRGLGNTLVALGEPALAIPQYRAALDRAPQDFRTYLGLGAAHDLAGDHGAAQAVYQSGLTVAPNNSDLRHNLGLSQYLGGDEEAGIGALRDVAASAGATAQQRQTLVMVLALSGRETEARELAAFDLDPVSIDRNMEYFRTIRGLQDPERRLQAIRAFMAGGRVPAS